MKSDLSFVTFACSECGQVNSIIAVDIPADLPICCSACRAPVGVLASLAESRNDAEGEAAPAS